MILDKSARKSDGREILVFPASFAQQRLWFIEQLLPENSLYVIPLVFRLSGPLRPADLRRSFQAIVDRHEILRTTFDVVDGQLLQTIAPELSVSLETIDLRALNDGEARALDRIREEIRRPFDLNRGPLFRLQLWRSGDEEHLLAIVLHHIIFDEWSSGVLIRELGELYTAAGENRPAVLPELPVQYADFACWQREWLRGEALERQLDYWKRQLRDTPPIELPGAASRRGHRGASQLFELPRDLLEALEELSRREGVTLFMILLAAFQTLLHRYTGQTDIAIGSPIANRHRGELEGLIGFFVNSLVLRTDLSGEPTFREVLNRVREITLAAYARQDLPFEKLVEELQPVRNPGENPLFQAVFALQNTPIEQLNLPGLVLGPVKLETETARFDLELYVWKSGDNFRNLWGEGWRETDGLRGVIVYNRDRFEESAIAALRHHFHTLLTGIVTAPDTPIAALPLLLPAERRELLNRWNGERAPRSPYRCIHEHFEERARDLPDEIALSFGDRQFTYRELNQGSNQLARYLQRLGVTPETPVGIYLERGAEAIAAILAVLKAGGVYVPLDPDYPAERVRFTIEDARIAVVIAATENADFLETRSTRVVCLPRERDEIARESDENPSVAGNPDRLAYILYTSGSTGTPKGVEVPHRAVDRLVRETDYIQIEPGDRIAGVASLAFDAATFEIWGALVNGAALIGIDRETTLSPADFATRLREEEISVLFLTTALFDRTVSQVPDAFRSLKYLLFGGETARVAPVRSVLENGKPEHFIHVYGPTENTTFSTWYEVRDIPEDATTIPIGRAIANTRIYLLDTNLDPLPAGAIGEIYLGGDGVARGYLNRPELTAERFIAFENAILYRTGDRARYRPDGDWEFLGRTDRQIKIRGFRVELGEIEAVLAGHPKIASAVVVTREIEENLQLIAYIVPESGAGSIDRDLRLFLKARLPGYMVPAAFVALERFPLTPNGKIDRRALPSPNPTAAGETGEIVAPTTSIEASLVEIWSRLLGRERVGIEDNFFELGGHSLLATRLVSRVRDRHGVELPLRCVFATPTIAGLAAAIERLEGTAESDNSISRLAVSNVAVFPLSSAQQRLWFLDRLAPDNPFYNVPIALRVTGKLDRPALESSLREIARRHATLRTNFTTLDGQAVQVVHPEVEIEVVTVDLREIAGKDRARVGQQMATEEARRPFNLSEDRLLRVTVLELNATEAILLLTLHHIVADGWSLGVLIRELAVFYRASVEGKPATLPPLSIQYTDFARWQRERLQGKVLEKQLAYWRERLRDLPTLDLPIARPRPAVQTYRGATYPVRIPAALAGALETLSRRSGVSLFMTLLAAFQTLLYRYTEREDIAIGVPIANRHRSEVEGLIGFFVNSLVMRSDLSGNPTFRELLERVRKVALEAYENQDLPFEKLVEELDPRRDLSRNPLFQIAFALQNAPVEVLELPGVKLEPAPLESTSARFDLEFHLWEPGRGLGSLWESGEGLSGFIVYSTDLFDRERIERLTEHFQTLLAGIVANPDTRLLDLPLLTDGERQRILKRSNRSDREGIDDRFFHEIFEERARSAPSAIAVVSGGESLTYGNLNDRADRRARVLRGMGVGADSPVGLFLDRSIDAVVSLLAILKAGGAYLPLDPNYPEERLRFLLTDSRVSIVLTRSDLANRLPTVNARVLYIDLPLPEDGGLENDPGDRVTSDNLAYIIYTSGSTGAPKGVLLTHRGLSNTVAAGQKVFQPSPNSRVLQFSSLSFDASVFEIALALGSGGTLYIPPESARLPGIELVRFLEDNGITHALLTPAVLGVLPDAELLDLQTLVTGGEACSERVVDRWAANRRFFNAYGPTEATIWATVAELHPGDNPRTIGRPVGDTDVYILDRRYNPVPDGVPGELYIGGAGLARGYLERPELTVERFIDLATPDPTRLYRTGDRARYRADGAIEFLGRIDDQVKVRGFRVEPGEIEATLQRHPAIREAVAVAEGEPSGETRLTAYFSLDREYCQKTHSLQTEQIQHWRTLYDRTYESSNPGFDTVGWNSSYTGEPIPLAEMREWARDRVERILAPQPDRVLEIGCGTGLLLFSIAPRVRTYVGTDFSTVVLDSLRKRTDNLPHVRLLHRVATDFEEIEPASFDAVILNSIVQYFPSVDYLLEVLEGAIDATADGGVLFLGDIRSLPLLEAFHASVQFFKADESMERTRLQQKVNRARFEEPELAIAPAFFFALRERFPRIQRAIVRLARGRGENEMVRFRYDVSLYIGRTGDDGEGASIERYDWRSLPIAPEEIQKRLLENRPEIVRIERVRNRRISEAVSVARWLREGEAPATVGRLRDLLLDAKVEAIDPEDWWELERVTPYNVEITWSTDTGTGDYDVLLLRRGGKTGVNFPVPTSPRRDWRDYTNDPPRSTFARQLVPEIRQHLKRTLPDYMIPSTLVPLETIPLNANGKVDRRALATLREDPIATGDAGKFDIETLTDVESTLIDIWKELLRRERVSVDDNFFELGGHSLLATRMTSRVRDVFGRELPLKSVFETPTIAGLARILRSSRDLEALDPYPPLVPLDRSAYRRGLPSRTVQEFRLTVGSPLVLLSRGGNREPFFCVSPMFGVVFPYVELARHLGGDRPFYGLQAVGLNDGSPPLDSIEAIAARYVAEIQTLQPRGPYYLGGWSFGGIVAFEMARQLIDTGREVALLAILDTPAPAIENRSTLYGSLKFLFKNAARSILPFLLDFGAILGERAGLADSRFSRWQWFALARLIPEESRARLKDETAIGRILAIVRANLRATYRYAPRPYPDRLALFTAEESSDLFGDDPTLGWDAWAKEIRCHRVPGDHLSLLKQPHVGILARQLEEYLR